MKDWWALIRKEFDDEEEDFLPEDIDEVEPSKDMDYLTMTDKTLKDRWYGILEQISTTSDFQPMVQGGGRPQRRKGKGLIMAAKTFAADMMDNVANIRTKKTGETERMSDEELEEEKGFTMNEVTQIVNISLGSPLSNVMDTLNSRIEEIKEQDLQELEFNFQNYDNNSEDVPENILEALDQTGIPDAVKNEVVEKVSDVLWDDLNLINYERRQEATQLVQSVFDSKAGKNYIGHLLISAMQKLIRERDVISPEDMDETIPDFEPKTQRDVSADFKPDDDEDTWQGSIGDKYKGPRDWFSGLRK